MPSQSFPSELAWNLDSCYKTPIWWKRYDPQVPCEKYPAGMNVKKVFSDLQLERDLQVMQANHRRARSDKAEWATRAQSPTESP